MADARTMVQWVNAANQMVKVNQAIDAFERKG